MLLLLVIVDIDRALRLSKANITSRPPDTFSRTLSKREEINLYVAESAAITESLNRLPTYRAIDYVVAFRLNRLLTWFLGSLPRESQMPDGSSIPLCHVAGRSAVDPRAP